MKTIVLVSIPGAVLGLELSDFPTGGPVEGRRYEFEGKLFKITEITETLGYRTLVGTKVSSDSRLLGFADAVCHGDESLKANMIKPKHVGANGPEDVLSAGGIIIGQTEEKAKLETSGSDPVHIMFVKAVLAESKSGSVNLPLSIRLQTFVSGAADSLLGGRSNGEEMPINE